MQIKELSILMILIISTMCVMYIFVNLQEKSIVGHSHGSLGNESRCIRINNKIDITTKHLKAVYNQPLYCDKTFLVCFNEVGDYFCDIYKSYGDCYNSNSTWMKENCAKACEHCKGKSRLSLHIIYMYMHIISKHKQKHCDCNSFFI